MPGTIVVGVDGSPASLAALRFGAEEAQLRGATLVAVHAWLYIPPATLVDPGLISTPVVDLPGNLEAMRDAAEAEFESALGKAFPDGPPAGLEHRLVEGEAADVLTAEANGATMVVVGSRGRSGITAALLGSVSRHVVDHAPCPAVVVKD